MRISDWSSDVCSSDLVHVGSGGVAQRACLGSAHEMMFLLHLDDSLSGSGLWGRKGSKNRPFRGCQGVRGAGEAVSARASAAAASHRARAVDLAVPPRIGAEPKKVSTPLWGMRKQIARAG